MSILEHDDALCLAAAQGWLDLGNGHEAAVELERIAPASRTHPDVLELRWKVASLLGNWQQCLRLAERLVQDYPDRPNGWVFLSISLHRLNQTEEALENLIEIFYDFPDTPVIAYELARYSCCLGQLAEAVHWLEEACQVGNPRTIHSMALDDPDMKPLLRHYGLGSK
jgi:tetratricopeptide (TPR) repeat protein